MIVSMWMTRDLVTAAPELRVAEAARLMARSHVRRLLVTRQQPDGLHLLGIVSARDVLHAFPPEINPFAVEDTLARQSVARLSEIMRHEVRTTTPDTPIEAAAAMMEAEKIGALPVLREQRLVGIITESDIFRAFVSLFCTAGAGARITFDISTGEDVVGLVTQLAARHRIALRTLVCTQQENQPVCVVRVEGRETDQFLEELWSSGHVVVNVVRFAAPEENPPKPE